MHIFITVVVSSNNKLFYVWWYENFMLSSLFLYNLAFDKKKKKINKHQNLVNHIGTNKEMKFPSYL